MEIFSRNGSDFFAPTIFPLHIVWLRTTISFFQGKREKEDSIAAALDPSLDVAEGLFPVADAIDVWTRDRWKRKQAFSERLYISCLPSMYNFSGSKYDFSFQLWKKEIEKRTKMKTCINISFPNKVRFRKKVHSQTSDHDWFFLTYSQSVRAKKKEKEKWTSLKELQRTVIL